MPGVPGVLGVAGNELLRPTGLRCITGDGTRGLLLEE